MKYLPFTLAPLALGLYSITVHADTVPAQLDDVVVTASRSEETAALNTSHIEVISSEEIRASQAQSVLDILQRRAVIQVTDSRGDGSTPILGMRGFGVTGSQNTLVLLDGRRFNNDTDLGPVNLRNISLASVERIEIVNGSSGTLFGAGAVGGVINIITKRPEQSSLELSVTRGNQDAEKYRASGSLVKGPWVLSLNGDKELSDNFRDNNALNSGFAQVRLGRQLSNGEIFVETSRQDQTVQLPGALSKAQRRADRRQSSTPRDYIEQIGDRSSIGGNWRLSEQWRLHLDASHRRDSQEGLITVFGTPSPLAQQREQIGISPRLTGSITALGKRHRVVTGLDHDQGTFTLTSVFGVTDGRLRTDNAYAHVTTELSETLELTTGWRLLRHENASRLGGYRPEHKDTANAGNIGLFWRATPRTQAWLRLDRNVRFATIDETTNTVYFDPGLPGLVQAGALDTQTGLSTELGIRQQIGAHQLTLQAYQIDLNNEIAYDSSRFINANLDRTRRTGATLSWQAPVHDLLDAQLQGSLVRARFTDGPDRGKDIPFVADHAVTATLTAKPHERARVILESQYTGRRHADSDYDNSNSKVSAVWVNNLIGSYQQGPITVSARINNLFDRDYDLYNVEDFLGNVQYYPASDRHILVTANYRFH